MSNIFVAAGKGVEVVGRQTWLEAIHRGNMAGKPIMPNSFYNEVFIGKDADGRFKPIPEEILKARPLYSGTLGVVGKKGTPLGASVEDQCEYAGTMKSVIVRPSKDDVALFNTILASDHLFGPDGKPLLLLSNAKTGKPIRNDDEMGEANEVLLRINGQTRRYVFNTRDGDVLETVGNEETFSWISDDATIGLFRRGYDFEFYYRRYVILGCQPFHRLTVVREASGAGAPATIETSSAKLTSEMISGDVILRGSDEQVQTALRVLRSQNLV